MRRIGTEGGGAGALKPLVPEELKADVHKLGRRIKNMNAFLLDPRSKFMQIWDFFTLSALFFTLTVTPFEARAPPRPHRARTAGAPRPHPPRERQLFPSTRPTQQEPFARRSREKHVLFFSSIVLPTACLQGFF